MAESEFNVVLIARERSVRRREGRDVLLTPRICGKPAGLGPVCESCGKQLHRGDLIAEQAPKYKSERQARWEAFKAGRRATSAYAPTAAK